MKIGLTGLTSAGKSVIFNLLIQESGSAKNQGDKSKVNLGSVKVPDQRLDELAKVYKPRRIVQTEITCTELPATPHKDDLFAGQALQFIQKMDALLLVVRAFDDPVIPHPDGAVDAVRDLQKMIFDMNFQDISTLEKRVTTIQSASKSLSAGGRAEVVKNIDRLKKIQLELENGVALRAQTLDKADLAVLSDTFLVSLLPLMVIVNIGEDDLKNRAAIEAEIAKILGAQNAGVAAICAKLESELAEMDENEQAEFRSAMDSGDVGLHRMIRLAYQTMGLISFLTVGEDEVRAWAIKNGLKAANAAKAIHSDIERGFIRAEVIGYDAFMSAGDMVTARKQGTLRREGRDYVVNDGDIVNFLFSV